MMTLNLQSPVDKPVDRVKRNDPDVGKSREVLQRHTNARRCSWKHYPKNKRYFCALSPKNERYYIIYPDEFQGQSHIFLDELRMGNRGAGILGARKTRKPRLWRGHGRLPCRRNAPFRAFSAQKTGFWGPTAHVGAYRTVF